MSEASKNQKLKINAKTQRRKIGFEILYIYITIEPYFIHRPEGTVYSSPGQTTQECRPGLEYKLRNRPRDNIEKRTNLISDERVDPYNPTNDGNPYPSDTTLSPFSSFFLRTVFLPLHLPKALPLG
jgi:hypothetical protein